MTASGGVDILREAWKRVRKNRGAAGVDRLTLAEIEAYGVERVLGELQCALRRGSYRPAPVRRVAIAKPDGDVRPLGIPTVCDRVVQQAARLVLEAIFGSPWMIVGEVVGLAERRRLRVAPLRRPLKATAARLACARP